MSASKSQRTERMHFIRDPSNYIRARPFTVDPQFVGEGNGLSGIAAGQIGSNQNSRDINPHGEFKKTNSTGNWLLYAPVLKGRHAWGQPIHPFADLCD